MSTDSFFEWSTLGTLAGSTAGVVVVSNTARKLLRADSVWIPFITALVITVGLAIAGGSELTFGVIALTFLNACLLFCTALGVNDTVVEVVTPRPDGTVQAQGRRTVKLLQTWLARDS